MYLFRFLVIHECYPPRFFIELWTGFFAHGRDPGQRSNSANDIAKFRIWQIATVIVDAKGAGPISRFELLAEVNRRHRARWAALNEAIEGGDWYAPRIRSDRKSESPTCPGAACSGRFEATG
jgi:hypothetical protein